MLCDEHQSRRRLQLANHRRRQDAHLIRVIGAPPDAGPAGPKSADTEWPREERSTAAKCALTCEQRSGEIHPAAEVPPVRRRAPRRSRRATRTRGAPAPPTST
eukprot:8211062-Pyramimonas_sp.AAC.1